MPSETFDSIEYYRQLEIQEISKSLTPEFKPELAQVFSEESIQTKNAEALVELIKSHGSGHIAFHSGKLKYLDNYLRTGYLVPTALIADRAEIDPFLGHPRTSEGNLSLSRALHFSLDTTYMGGQDYGEVIFVCPVETLLENKAFKNIPLEHAGDPTHLNDMVASGLSHHPQDISHAFKIDNLGILFVSAHARAKTYTQPAQFLGQKEREEGETISVHELIENFKMLGLRVPNKIVFYTEPSAKEAILNYFQACGIKIPAADKKITVSDSVKFKYETAEIGGNPSGRGEFYSIK